MTTESINRVITRLEELSRDRDLERIVDYLSEVTLSGKYNYSEILDLESRLIEYLSLSIQLDNLNNR